MAKLSTKDKQGLGLIAGVLAILIVVMGLNYSLSDREKPDEKNCLPRVARKTVVVIDRSDATPRQTVEEIAARIRNYVSDSAQENELIAIYEVSEGARTALTPVFTSCVPKKDGNDLYEHRASIRKFYDGRFAKPLADALIRPAQTSTTSPIAEVLTDLSASDVMQSSSTRLMVFSDMMQNSSNSSLYGCRDGQAAIAAYRRSRSGSVERPEFRNTSVDLHLIPREGLDPAAVQCRARFWTWFFGDNEGAGGGVEFLPLPGGAPVNG
jgi:hypothetical protein